MDFMANTLTLVSRDTETPELNVVLKSIKQSYFIVQVAGEIISWWVEEEIMKRLKLWRLERITRTSTLT